jgi:dihydrofolate reductase
MRPVILFSAMSLDGFIAGPQGEIDWLFQDADYGYAAFYDRIGTMLMGRKTFDFVNSLTPYPHSDRENIVFTRSPKSSEADYLHFIQDDPVSFTKQLKTIPGKPIWLVGGGAINQLFVEAGLVDEMILSVHPGFFRTWHSTSARVNIDPFIQNGPCGALSLGIGPVAPDPIMGVVKGSFESTLNPGRTKKSDIKRKRFFMQKDDSFKSSLVRIDQQIPFVLHNGGWYAH